MRIAATPDLHAAQSISGWPHTEDTRQSRREGPLRLTGDHTANARVLDPSRSDANADKSEVCTDREVKPDPPRRERLRVVALPSMLHQSWRESRNE